MFDTKMSFSLAVTLVVLVGLATTAHATYPGKDGAHRLGRRA